MGGTRPYYRRVRPQPQIEADYLRDISLKWLVDRLRAAKIVSPGNELNISALMTAFPPSPKGSMRSLLSKMLVVAGVSPHIDITYAHMQPYGAPDPVGEAKRLFDKRAAAAVHGLVSRHLGVKIYPNIK